MGWYVRLKTMAVVLAGLAAACSDEGKENLEIGAACSADVECISNMCAPAGICTQDCDMHSDCGCATGTTNGDVASGLCDFGCMESSCTNTCASDLNCAGETECTSGEVFNGCL